MRRLLRRSFVLPAAAALLFVGGGCISIPVSHDQAPPNHWEGTAGGPDSSAPIRVGVTDRASVASVMGGPGYASGIDASAGEFWEYAYYHLTGYTLSLIPAHCNRLWSKNYERGDWLAVWFDPDGRVRKYEIWSDDQYKWPGPPDVVAEHERYAAEIQREVRAATQPETRR